LLVSSAKASAGANFDGVVRMTILSGAIFANCPLLLPFGDAVFRPA